jgi:hypothetical protein
MTKKKNRDRPRRQVAGRSMLQIKTTIDFGEDGIPLERLGDHEADERPTPRRQVEGRAGIRAHPVRPLRGSAL